ncbi:baseplate J/gp47 family protein [Vicingaceae bacterium]|nr:baseplate J/gp47 family protein [Vicingaceae bacterium]
MYNLQSNNDILNNGLSQGERLEELLSPDCFLIDEFDTVKFIEFISSYSKNLTYYNEYNKLNGDWSSFFEQDSTLSLLRLSSLNTNRLRVIFFKKSSLIKSIRDQDDQLKELHTYYTELIQFLIKIEHNVLQLNEYPKFKLEIETLITQKFAPILNQFLLFLKEHGDEKRTAFLENEFSNYWFTESDAVSLNDSKKSLDHLFSNLFMSANILAKNVLKFYEKDVEKAGLVRPHIALLITFHRLYGEASKQLNKITEKHLDYYYTNILQLDYLKSSPNKAYINFTIPEDKGQVEILSGEKLLAGTTEEGEDILYAIEDTLLINEGSIVEVKSIEISPFNFSEKVIPNLETNHTKHFFSTSNSEVSSDNLGFIFGADFLNLEEGYRKIRFDLNLTENSFTEFIHELGSYHPSIIEDETLLNEVLKSLFIVEYSNEGTWVALDEQNVETAIHKTETGVWGKRLEIIFFIDTISPPLSGLEDEDEDVKESPKVKFVINSSHYQFIQLLTLIKIKDIEIEVEVLDLKNLTLANDFGPLDQNSPFEPFGPQPVLGSSLIIGHPSLFLYPIHNFKLNIEWFGLPTIDGGFDEYYEAYPEIDGNDSFKVKLSSLRDKRWFPEEEKQLIDLFLPVPSAEENTVSSVRRINEINIEDLQLKTPIQYDANNDEFTKQSTAGFLKLELCYPLTAFGHGQYADLVRYAAIKSIKNKNIPYPNEPYTPVLKSITADVVTKMKYDESNLTDFYFGHIHPFGEQSLTELDQLIPSYQYGSTFLIGVSNLNKHNIINLFFRFNDNLSGLADDNLGLQWSVFNGRSWSILNAEEIISDTTLGFKKNGILELNLEKRKIDKTALFDDGNCWIKCESLKGSSFLNLIEDIIPHTATAVCLTPDLLETENIPSLTITNFLEDKFDVDSVLQKYPSFGGVKKEDKQLFYQRISERLRHKDRAVSVKDYEKIMLQKFPEIYRCKCITNTDDKFNVCPGSLLLTVVPTIESEDNEKFSGYFSAMELKKMTHYLLTKTPIGAKLKIVNPIYERVRTKFNVKLKEGFDPKFYLSKLNFEIKNFISPFIANSKKQVEFGESIQSTHILNFIEKQEYVDHIINFSVFHVVNDLIINQENAKLNSLEIKPTTSISILITDDNHQISLYDKQDATDKVGINEMMIGTDYIVENPIENTKKGLNNLIIGKNYKLMGSEVDSMEENSNFIVHFNFD